VLTVEVLSLLEEVIVAEEEDEAASTTAGSSGCDELLVERLVLVDLVWLLEDSWVDDSDACVLLLPVVERLADLVECDVIAGVSDLLVVVL